MKMVDRIIVLIHRYVGIPMSVLVAVWFISGIVMIYTGGMPALSENDRLASQPDLTVREVLYRPSEVALMHDIGNPVASVKLMTLLDRPAYRIEDINGFNDVIFADNGERFEGLTPEAGRHEAATFAKLPAGIINYRGTIIEPDQWTLTERRHLPLLVFDADDDDSTTLYLSETTGEIVLATSRGTRVLAWIGAIPHWLYFTALRTNQQLWYQTIVWLSVIGCVVGFSGMILLFTRLRPSKPFRLADSIPYRDLMRWHYYAGALFGIFTLTWLFSGLLSMEPFAWNSRPGLEVDRYAFTGEPVDLTAFGSGNSLAAAGSGARELEFRQILGRPYLLAKMPGNAGVLTALFDAETLDTAAPINQAEIVEFIERAAGTLASSVTRLDTYDAYYYDRDGNLPLPVLRISFDDPALTSLYVDPALASIVRTTHRSERVERWLFNGLHSLDFPFWYDVRPLWDIGVILLSIGGLALSGIGIVLGVRRIRRSIQY